MLKYIQIGITGTTLDIFLSGMRLDRERTCAWLLYCKPPVDKPSYQPS